jgi:hypothetical protein
MKNILEHEPLSETQIREALNNDVNILKYSDIEEYKTLEDLFNGKSHVVLLWDYTQNFGHWTLLTKINNNEITFFDSYGMIPEYGQRQYIPQYYKKKNYPSIHYLGKLLHEFHTENPKINITYNEFKFQKHGENILTCGHWVIFRALHNHLDVYDFMKLFKPLKDRDNAIILLTKKILYKN